MKKVLIVVGFIVLGCGKATPTCQTGELLGSDNQCYSCTYGTPEYASSEFGYCGSLNAGGVACCSSAWYNYGNVTCYPSYPCLCSLVKSDFYEILLSRHFGGIIGGMR